MGCSIVSSAHDFPAEELVSEIAETVPDDLLSHREIAYISRKTI